MRTVVAAVLACGAVFMSMSSALASRGIIAKGGKAVTRVTGKKFVEGGQFSVPERIRVDVRLLEEVAERKTSRHRAKFRIVKDDKTGEFVHNQKGEPMRELDNLHIAAFGSPFLVLGDSLAAEVKKALPSGHKVSKARFGVAETAYPNLDALDHKVNRTISFAVSKGENEKFTLDYYWDASTETAQLRKPEVAK